MGAEYFSSFASGTDMNQAFRDAQSQARHEYGSDPYNGTISTVQSCKRVAENAVPEDVAGSMEEVLWRDLEEKDVIAKWNSCAAIPVADNSDFAVRQEELEFHVDSERYPSNSDLRKIVEKKFSRSPGEMIGRIRYDVKENQPSFEETQEEMEEQFAVLWQGGSAFCDSKEEALKRARSFAFETRVVALPKEAIKIKRQSAGFSVKATFKVYKRQAASPEIIGWNFFGLASC